MFALKDVRLNATESCEMQYFLLVIEYFRLNVQNFKFVTRPALHSKKLHIPSAISMMHRAYVRYSIRSISISGWISLKGNRRYSLLYIDCPFTLNRFFSAKSLAIHARMMPLHSWIHISLANTGISIYNTNKKEKVQLSWNFKILFYY